jgi:hypothetical protein
MTLDLGHNSQRDLLRGIYGNATIDVTDADLNTSDWNGSQSFPKPTVGGSAAGRDKLWAYLIEGDGPFGEVDPTQVWLSPYYDNVDGVIVNWPSTMMPFAMVKGRAMLGIDPTRNVIVIGNKDMFSATNRYFEDYPDKYRFLQNFLSYMVNAAQYGNVFLDQFK